ncbi:hypothetical protein PR202_gb03300 [Eleusine coracana subsp. coracana]|uniref:NB-ARC domain-containing protein n=1 Tax=Eleusine coracana subsp. coracana TaxID=191504 RepID=A0AAV5E1N4_ELECO|nr:hypothetical protein PR202_gb03220 [Eleusine coracana subsp. coracana]GJN16324.1 hypothetical protein PR202_gb03300 [Eleusine coracana subsp. coracana]
MEVSCEILKKCGGLPLAIITVASILANQPTKIKEQWEYIKNSLSVELAEDSTLEDMMHILDLSYKNLPRHLKACFLYLGIYPEDWEIRRNELVRQWVAGGFVGNSPGRDVWDIANSYFNELINRSMIQPAYDDLNVEVLSCKLHDMMRDLIVRRCNEDNFLRVLHDLQDVAQVQDKVRRLSLDLSFRNDGTMPITTSGHLSKVRSLAIFGGSQHIPSFLEFKFIRVLFLDFSKLVTRIDLTSITQLSQLRYLKAECSIWFTGFPKLSTILPSQICRVRYLETLELPWTSSCSIPKDIIYLPRLSHLVLPLGTRLPDGIGKLKSLRTLRGFSLSKSSFENTKDISELTNLEELALIISREVYWNTMLVCGDDDDTSESIWMAALSSCLEKLSNLKRLSMESYSVTLCGDALSSFSPSFHKLEDLDLSGWAFSRVPIWIGDLQNLSMLELTSKSTCREDVGIIGMLPSLVRGYKAFRKKLLR